MTQYHAAAADMLNAFDWETIAHYMDRETAEDLNTKYAPCENLFFLEIYMAEHARKFDEEFTIN